MLETLESFYRGKTVFITGHTGFKGIWLSLWLEMLGANVTGYALLPKDDESYFSLFNKDNNFHSVFGDIRDAGHLTKILKEVKPDLVFHLAAQPLVRQSYVDPVDTYTSNVMGTIHLFEAIRQTDSVKAVVNVTTDKCYANQEWAWPYRETDRLGGHDPYSTSKACVELISDSYGNAFFREKKIALATARAGNVIGGGDKATDRLIPDIIRSLETSQDIVIRNPKAVRPWQHVLEALSGYLILGMTLYNHRDMGLYNGAYNFGPRSDNTKNVLDITEKFISCLGKGKCIIEDSAAAAYHETSILTLDSTRAQEKLGWKPIFSFDETMDYTSQWFAGYFEHAATVKEMTLKQIYRYSQLMKLRY